MFVMVCKATNSGVKGILKNEFGYRVVNSWEQSNTGKAKNAALKDWDVLYGGGCRNDWLQASGLKDKLDFAKLRPKQVVYPCLGPRDSFSNKFALCRMLRDNDPDSCFLLPEDRERVAEKMDGKTVWVVLAWA